jgi:hypothetical protein
VRGWRKWLWRTENSCCRNKFIRGRGLDRSAFHECSSKYRLCHYSPEGRQSCYGDFFLIFQVHRTLRYDLVLLRSIAHSCGLQRYWSSVPLHRFTCVGTTFNFLSAYCRLSLSNKGTSNSNFVLHASFVVSCRQCHDTIRILVFLLLQCSLKAFLHSRRKHRRIHYWRHEDHFLWRHGFISGIKLPICCYCDCFQ